MIEGVKMGRRKAFHQMWGNSKLNMQDGDFLFTDTETNEYRDTPGEGWKEKTLTLKLGWALLWNRKSGRKKWFKYTTASDFWDFVEASNQGKLTLFAHNMGFDLRPLDGMGELVRKRGYKVGRFFTSGGIFILTLKKKGKTLALWDTTNYVPKKLATIGEALKYPKHKIDLKTCSNAELSRYCKRDVVIIYEFIKQLMIFLEDNGLTQLKPTASAVALNAFRHRFYDNRNHPLLIHSWDSSIDLENDSYKGGVADCFWTGVTEEETYKADVNSMYPNIMWKYGIPSKLVYHSNNKDDTDLLGKFLKSRGKALAIADCDIYLPEKEAYILTKGKVNGVEKCMFLWGKFRVSLCSPELEYVLKYGRILKMYQLSLYDSHPHFRGYVEFFYRKRREYEREGNHIFALFCKILLNSLYGKFAQRNSEMVLMTEEAPFSFGSWQEVKDGEITDCVQYDNQIWKVTKTKKSSYDSFIAVSSMITSYARMELVRLIKLAGRENVYYCDTDSLIVNKEGLRRLAPMMDKGDKTLGMLKLEGTSQHTEIHAPKFYVFGKKLKLKGLKEAGKITVNNDKEIVAVQEQWEGFLPAQKKGVHDRVRITKVTKHFKKAYDKGLLDDKGRVHPYSSGDLKRLARL